MKKLFKKSVSLFMAIAIVATFTASLAINSSALEYPAEKSVCSKSQIINVKNEKELRKAIKNQGCTIKLTNDICVHGDLNIDRPLAIYLNDHLIILLNSKNGINIDAKAGRQVSIYGGTVQGAINSSTAINLVSGNLSLSYISIYGGNFYNSESGSCEKPIPDISFYLGGIIYHPENNVCSENDAYGNALACLSEKSTVYIVDSDLFGGYGFDGTNDRQGKAIYDVVSDLSNIYQIALL